MVVQSILWKFTEIHNYTGYTQEYLILGQYTLKEVSAKGQGMQDPQMVQEEKVWEKQNTKW